jgi:hypothetical protein
MLPKGFERANQNIAIDLKDVPITPAYINQINLFLELRLWQIKWMNALHIRGNQAVINSLKGFTLWIKLILPTKH